MSERTFEKCKADLEGKNIVKLEGLFELWKEAHEIEIEDKIDKRDINKKEFVETVYEKKGNTISSHFTQFFEKECNHKQCSKAKEHEGKAWEIALKKAFNMDGTYENFDVKKGGYGYICLLKEANDSKKTCINDYLKQSSVVNEWIVDDGREVCGRKYKSDLLNKLNEAFAKLNNVENSDEAKENFDFKDEVAYMNVNKRGGTSRTVGRDETAVINYAEKYKEFILKEIEILSQNQEEVRVFVCGGKSYFTRLMRALFGENVEIVDEKTSTQHVKDKNLTFIQIPHPSYWRVSVEKLVEEMNPGGEN